METDIEQMHHVARLAFLAMAVRAVALTEFDEISEVSSMVITIRRPEEVCQLEPAIVVELLTVGGMPIGGMSL